MSTDEKVNWLNQWEEVLLGGDLPEGWEEKLEAYSANDPDAYAAYRGYDIIEKFNQLPKISPGMQSSHMFWEPPGEWLVG